VESSDIQGEARLLSSKLIREESLTNSCRIFWGRNNGQNNRRWKGRKKPRICFGFFPQREK